VVLGMLIGGYIPRCRRSATVVQGLRIGSAPFGPVVPVVRVVVVSAAFGEIHLHLRVRSLYFAHHAGHSHIAVPGNRIYVSSEVRIIELRYHPAPVNVVVIEDPYFRSSAGSLKQRSNMVGDELGLAFL